MNKYVLYCITFHLLQIYCTNSSKAFILLLKNTSNNSWISFFCSICVNLLNVYHSHDVCEEFNMKCVIDELQSYNKFNNLIKWSSYMWHDQGKLVTCRQYSIWVFNKIYLPISNPTFWSIPISIRHLVLKIWQFFEFNTNVKHSNMSSVLAYNSKSILAPTDSFTLIMSHIYI